MSATLAICARHLGKLGVKLGVLGVGVWMAYPPDDPRPRVATTNAIMSEVEKGLEEFKLNHDRYPEKLDDLARRPAYLEASAWPRGGYLKKTPQDGWRRDFVYRVPGTGGRSYDLVSLGADGRAGGCGADSDLCNHE